VPSAGACRRTVERESLGCHRGRLPRLLLQPRAVSGRHPHAPGIGEQHQQGERTGRAARSVEDVLGRSSRAGREARLSQFASDGAGADRNDRIHDGLRHHGHRARSRAGEVQEAGWRGDDQDREQHGPGSAVQARLRTGAGGSDRQLHRRDRHHRRRAPHQGRASARLRLLLQTSQGNAFHSLHGTPADDGGDATVHLRRNLEDGEPARERVGG